ncbi:hypothetical protein BH11PSE7_BH11PSE7_34600 [soil metagenome]
MPKLSTVSMAAVAAAFFVQSATAGLFGPSKDLLKGDELAQKFRARPLVVILSGNQLDVRSKSAAVGGFLLGFIASSAMASGGGYKPGMNAQQMGQNLQANAQIASSFHQNFQTAFASIAAAQAGKSAGQVAREGPVSVVSQGVVTGLAQTPDIKLVLPGGDASGGPKLELRLKQPEWMLDFSMASDEYELSYKLEISLYQADGDTVYFSDTCLGHYGRKMPKDDWERDDFAAIAAASAEVATTCSAQFLASMGVKPPQATAALPAPAITSE